MMQASKANESVSECSKLCLPVEVLRLLSRGKHESQLNVTGVQCFRLQN